MRFNISQYGVVIRGKNEENEPLCEKCVRMIYSDLHMNVTLTLNRFYAKCFI